MKYLLGFVLLFLVACQPKTFEETSDLQYFPSDYSLVVKTHSETLALFLESKVASSYPFVPIGSVKPLSELALSFLTTPTMVDLGLYEEGKGTLTFLALERPQFKKLHLNNSFTRESPCLRVLKKKIRLCIGRPWVKK